MLYSNHSEASRVFNGCLETFPKDFLRAVFRNEQLIEASVRGGQSLVIFSILNNIELKRLQAVNGSSVTPCGKCQPFATAIVFPLL